MALSAFAGSFQIPASTGNQDVTGLGLEPKAILLYMQGDSSITLPDARSVGVATASSEQGCVCAFGSDYLNKFSGGAGTSTVLRHITPATAAVLHAAALDSFLADGFRLSWSSVGASNRCNVGYIALGGADLSNAKVVSFTRSTTGSYSTTGLGFQPTSLIVLATKPTTDSGVEGSISLGWTDGTASFVVGNNGYDNVGRRSAVRSTKLFEIVSGWGSTILDGTLVSLDADGFTITLATCTDPCQFVVMALRGPQVKAGTFSSPTSTGSQATTGVGFQPAALLTLGNGETAAGVNTTKFKAGFGAGTSSTNRVAVAGFTESGNADGVVSGSQIVRHLSDATPTTLVAADLTSLDADGFTLNWSTVDASARMHGYLAFGNAVGGGGGSTFVPQVIMVL